MALAYCIWRSLPGSSRRAGCHLEHAISIAICILANSTPSDSLTIPVSLAFHMSLSLSLLSIALKLVAGSVTDGSEKEAFSKFHCLQWTSEFLSVVVYCALGQLEISLWPGMIQVGLSSRSLVRFT